MANQNRRAGRIFVRSNGRQYDAKGSFSYGLGLPLRNDLIGADRVHGYYETAQAAFIEGVITDSSTLDLAELCKQDGVSVTLELANGKTIVLSNAWYAGDGKGTTEQGEITVKWCSAEQGEEF